MVLLGMIALQSILDLVALATLLRLPLHID